MAKSPLVWAQALDSISDSTTLIVLSIAAGLLLTWRLWRFSVLPRLYPNEPKEAPYWIPCHAIPLALDFNGSLARIIERFGGSKRPFAIVAGGVKIYIITDPKHVAETYRNETILSNEAIVRGIHAGVGMSPKGVNKLFTVDESASFNQRQPRPLPPIGMMVDTLRHHLAPGIMLDGFLDQNTLPLVRRAFDFEREVPHPALLGKKNGLKAISLEELCIEALITNVLEVFYGPVIWKLKPDFVHWFLLWERVNWKFLFNWPGILSRDMLAAKAEMTDMFEKYFSLPRSERPGAAPWMVVLEDNMRESNLTTEELARVLTLQTWAIVGNMYKSAFWLIAHLVYNPSDLEIVRTEILPAIKGDQIDHHHLMKDCPILDSLMSEVLRITTSTPIVRDVLEDICISGTTLRKGNKMLVSYRQLHLSSESWGPNPEVIQADRFQQNKSLKSSLCFRPFGGGSTLCPGRFYARGAIYPFVALLLSRYDISIGDLDRGLGATGNKQQDPKNASFPRPDYSKPIPGVVSPAEGEDIRMVLSPRNMGQ
ncbi:cytochrome P450 [Penicillium sp. IBT 35674x]|nr:cytochrome P450 [Penicillium sp. IBT 35674x]